MSVSREDALEALLHAVLLRASRAQMDDDGTIDEETQDDIDQLLEAGQDPQALAALLSEEGDHRPFEGGLRFGPGDLLAGVRAELLGLIRPGAGPGLLGPAREVLDRYRAELGRQVAARQLEAGLTAMRRVVESLPGRSAPGAGAPSAALPSAEHLTALAGIVAELPEEERSAWFAGMDPLTATSVRERVESGGSGPPWTVDLGTGEPEPVTRFPIIDEAVRDLRGRQVLTRDAFDRLTAEARSRAFTVAGEESEKVLAEIRDGLADVVEEGPSLAAFRERVGDRISPSRVETVYRTGAQEALSRGMDEVLAHPVVAAAFPYEETVPIRDSRLSEVCEICSRSGIQGTGIYRRDDPTWARVKPPRHPNCRCARVPLSVEQAAQRGIEEAKQWLETGREPSPPAHVPMPDVEIPEGWR